MSEHYILNGHEAVPCDLMTWAKWLDGHRSDRVVAKTAITPEVEVSTVFIGLDHSFLPGAPPLIFETMIFGGPLDSYTQRYSTWDEAAAGHAKAVALAQTEKATA